MSRLGWFVVIAATWVALMVAASVFLIALFKGAANLRRRGGDDR